MSEEFEVEGRRVVLVDTPGFDNTKMSDPEVLKTVAAFLGELYAKHRYRIVFRGYANKEVFRYSARKQLIGIVYIHRTSDDENRHPGALGNLRILMELCGGREMRNVLLVVNQHSEGTLLQIARQFYSGTEYFKPALEMGAEESFLNVFQNANSTVKKFSIKWPVVLKIQRELIDEGRDFRQTGAGTELKRKMVELIAIRNERITNLEATQKQAVAKQDRSLHRQLGRDKRIEEWAVQRLERGIAEMESTFGEDSREKENRVVAVGAEAREVEIEERKEPDRVSRESVEECNRVIRELEEGKQQAVGEVKELRRELEEQERRAKGVDALSKENTAKMARSMEKMDREAKELRQALDEQRVRAQEAEKRIAEMQSKFEEERNRSGE